MRSCGTQLTWLVRLAEGLALSERQRTHSWAGQWLEPQLVSHGSNLCRGCDPIRTCSPTKNDKTSEYFLLLFLKKFFLFFIAIYFKFIYLFYLLYFLDDLDADLLATTVRAHCDPAQTKLPLFWNGEWILCFRVYSELSLQPFNGRQLIGSLGWCFFLCFMVY